MQNEMELQQVIYNLIVMQIQFGGYRCGDSLPTIKEASGFFLASVDTIRLAYVRLKQEGYISLSTCVGATVKVRYSEEEIRGFIQAYFACRKDAILDLARSALPLYGHAQFLAFTSASLETLDALERSNRRKDVPAPYRMSQQYLLFYGALGNGLLMRLIWQMFLFFQAPFFSIPHNAAYFMLETRPPRDVMSELIRLCREKDWDGLWRAIRDYGDRRLRALLRFYETEIRPEPEAEQIAFLWSPYKKASQLCYSLCMELMGKIRSGEYPAGSFLPSLSQLTREKGVSLNTARRTLGLLGKLGTVESVNRVGTRVLPLFDCTVHCDFTDGAVQKRLLDFTQGFHILALSCRLCAKLTLEAMDANVIRAWMEQLKALRQSGIYEDVIVTCYAAIAAHTPYQAVRTVYNELTQQLFWGAPLREMHGNREARKAHFGPYLETLIDCLSHADAEGFSLKLEELQVIETKSAVRFLARMGVREAAGLLFFEEPFFS